MARRRLPSLKETFRPRRLAGIRAGIRGGGPAGAQVRNEIEKLPAGREKQSRSRPPSRRQVPSPRATAAPQRSRRKARSARSSPGSPPRNSTPSAGAPRE